MPRPRKVDEIARRYQGAARAAILAAWDQLAGSLPVDTVLAAMRTSVQAVVSLLESARLADRIIAETVVPLVEAMQAGGANAASQFRTRFDLPDADGMQRVLSTSDARDWLRYNVSPEDREFIRGTIQRAFMEGGHPYETARMIRSHIGVNRVQAGALERYAQGLPSTMTPAERERAIARQTERYIRQRADTIARTETMRAAREGQEEAWQQAVESGELDPDQAYRVWITAADPCDICQELADRGPIPFSDSFGDSHPSCRCSEALTFEKRRVAKPLGRWPDWDACVTEMTGRLGSKEAAERYCGKVEQLTGG